VHVTACELRTESRLTRKWPDTATPPQSPFGRDWQIAIAAQPRVEGATVDRLVALWPFVATIARDTRSRRMPVVGQGHVTPEVGGRGDKDPSGAGGRPVSMRGFALLRG